MANQATRRARRPFNLDYRIPRADGSVQVFHVQGRVILSAEGVPIRLVGTAQDVSEVRQAERAREEYTARLQTLSHRLLEVQETERRHLARELHDEVGQLLTGLHLLLNLNGNVRSGASASKLEQARAVVDDLLDKSAACPSTCDRPFSISLGSFPRCSNYSRITRSKPACRSVSSIRTSKDALRLRWKPRRIELFRKLSPTRLATRALGSYRPERGQRRTC